MTRAQLLAGTSSAELTEWVAFYRDEAERGQPQPGAHRHDPLVAKGLR